ncbi:MAG: TetR/AcrR family transcriptional regulator [Pseudomonadota bacterium]
MDTKTRLMDQAERLARQRGVDAFSFADLSTALAIKKASVHYHFPTKADLIAQLLDRYAERVGAALHEISQSENSAAAQLSAYVSIYRAALQDGQSLCLCVAYASAPESVSQGVQDRLNAFHTSSMAWLETVFARGQYDGTIRSVAVPNAESAATLALVEGAQLVARAAQDVSRFDAATQFLMDRLTKTER